MKPVIPIRSASTRKSTASTFSSTSSIVWGGGVSAAIVGSARLGRTHGFPSTGRDPSRVQKLRGFLGDTSAMCMRIVPLATNTRRATPAQPRPYVRRVKPLAARPIRGLRRIGWRSMGDGPDAGYHLRGNGGEGLELLETG